MHVYISWALFPHKFKFLLLLSNSIITTWHCKFIFCSGTLTTHRRPLAVAEHLRGEGHTFLFLSTSTVCEGHALADVTVLAIDKIHSHNSCLNSQDTGKQVDQDPAGDFIPFGDEPQGGLPVKPARRTSIPSSWIYCAPIRQQGSDI